MGDDFRTKWGVAAALVVAGYLLAWWQTPVDPDGEERVVEPLLIVMTMTMPPGPALAALSARFARRSRVLSVAAWIAVVLFGVWTAGWTVLTATWSGRIGYCDESGFPPCFTDWAPRLVVLAATATTLSVCVFVESRLRKRWSPSAPS